MKKVYCYFTISICSLLVFFGCSTEDNSIMEVPINEDNSISYLSKSSTDRLAKDLLFNTGDFLYTIDIEEFKKRKATLSNRDVIGPENPEDPTAPLEETILRHELTRYWTENEDVLITMSNELGLENAITVKQMVDYGESLYLTINYPERNGGDDSMAKLIAESPFLNDIQKKYALELWNASNSNNQIELSNVLERLYNDRNIYPELEIFNFALSFVSSLNLDKLEKNSYSNRCPIYVLHCDSDPPAPVDKPSCIKASIESAVIGGVIGMVSGSIKGGLIGVSVGLIFGGAPAVPAGGAGAVAGAVLGAASGFTLGLIAGYIQCRTFPD